MLYTTRISDSYGSISSRLTISIFEVASLSLSYTSKTMVDDLRSLIFVYLDLKIYLRGIRFTPSFHNF